MIDFKKLEERRVALQRDLDGGKTAAQRNQLGQFATPPILAAEIVRHGVGLLPKESAIDFLDPAIGSGAFYSALRQVAPNGRVNSAWGYEIDSHYGEPSRNLWRDTGLELRLEDFTRATPRAYFNLIICNPPYVRHHHMNADDKSRLMALTLKLSGAKLSGLAGLYCHFLGISHGWMAQNCVAGWLIPSEFMDVNYGSAVKDYLLSRVTLLQIHRFDPNDVQFFDALVSSAVVWFRNSDPKDGHKVVFTYGGTLDAPKIRREISLSTLRGERKWTRFPAARERTEQTHATIGDFFTVKRGLATGDNGYFILTEEEIKKRGLPMMAFKPILPSVRYIEGDVVESTTNGMPKLSKRCFLLDPGMSEQEVAKRLPTLVPYLEEGKARGMHERYLCSHRKIWFAQENRPAPPLVCTYLGRSDTKGGRPFRFILNRSQATVANTYLAMYPKPEFAQAIEKRPEILERVWKLLNSISPTDLLGEGRVYGGGLHKLEPRELTMVPVPQIAALLSV